MDARIPTLTSATISGAFTKGLESMQCTTSLATKVFEQYIMTRLGVVVGRFKHKINSVNKNIDWKWTLLDFCFRNIFSDTQTLTNILREDIWMAIQLGLNEIEGQLFSLMGEFQQKLLDEASALDLTQLQLFTHGLYDCDRGASALHHCQARQQDEPADDSFFKGSPLSSSIHDVLLHLPLHGEEVYPELKMGLEREILQYSAAVFQQGKQDPWSHSVSDAILAACTIPVPVIVLCLSAIFVCNVNSSELHFQSVALRS